MSQIRDSYPIEEKVEIVEKTDEAFRSIQARLISFHKVAYDLGSIEKLRIQVDKAEATFHEVVDAVKDDVLKDMRVSSIVDAKNIVAIGLVGMDLGGYTADGISSDLARYIFEQYEGESMSLVKFKVIMTCFGRDVLGDGYFFGVN